MTTRLYRLAAALGLAVLVTGSGAVAAPSHGLSIFGDLKYKADFKHFDYVDPNAPKGGQLSMIGPSGTHSFDSFNNFILRGEAAQGLGLLYDTLMEPSADEPGSAYGLLAQSADLAPDGMSVTFKLRPEARFSDGNPVTAEDVVFSLNILKSKGHPTYRIIYRDVVKAEALDRLTVRFTFQGQLVRDLPLAVAGMAILPKAYYDKQPFEETTLKVPVGSGPYTIGSHKQGTSVTFKRRPDYWGMNLPVNRGRYNFDAIQFEYYRDRTTELQGLKGGSIDLREEFTARDWVTAYDVPAVKQGKLIKLTMPDETPSGAQGFFFNTRRAKFMDPRLRHALALAFDYEWTNANIFFGLYTRTESYFENSDMKAKGKPSPAELALLEPFRAKLPPEVFGEAYAPPKSDGSGSDRKLLRQALQLLGQAGWKLGNKDGRQALLNAKGEQLELEFLDTGGSVFERILAPYIRNLQLIGVKATMRNVDSSQYQSRVKTFDFDVVTTRFTIGLTPGIELYTYLGSSSANSQGSRNLAGIHDPVIDALIDKVIAAKSRADLVTATRAIDRVLRVGHYWVPHWYKAAHNVAYWDKFGRPKFKPKYARGITDTWWYDVARAARLKAR